MRAADATWDAVAEALHVGRTIAREHGLAIGAPKRPDSIAAFVPVAPELDDRRPMTAGHPVSWGAITAGTLLEGARFPRLQATPAELEDAA